MTARIGENIANWKRKECIAFVYSPSEFLWKINKKNYEIMNNYSSLIIHENVFSNLCLECPPNREILTTLNTNRQLIMTMQYEVSLIW